MMNAHVHIDVHIDQTQSTQAACRKWLFPYEVSGGEIHQWRDPHPSSLLLHEYSCTTDDVIFDRWGEEGSEWLQRLQQLHQVT